MAPGPSVHEATWLWGVVIYTPQGQVLGNICMYSILYVHAWSSKESPSKTSLRESLRNLSGNWGTSKGPLRDL